MITTILNELKKSFNPYAPFWDEWKGYRFNGLDITDIYIIEVLAERDFKPDINEYIMFCNNQETVSSLITKLKGSYTEFQDWLIRKFQWCIIEFAEDTPLNLFFIIPLYEFYTIQFRYKTLSADLIKLLMKFNCQTLSEIFVRYSELDFREEEKFAIISEFQAQVKIEESIYQSLEKEVKKLNQHCSPN